MQTCSAESWHFVSNLATELVNRGDVDGETFRQLIDPSSLGPYLIMPKKASKKASKPKAAKKTKKASKKKAAPKK